MAALLCPKCALKAFLLDPAMWGGTILYAVPTIPILLRIGMSYFPSFANLSMHYCTRAVILFASPGLDNAN